MITWILENTSIFLLCVIGLALWVSLATEYAKPYIYVLDSKIIALIFALIATVIAYVCGSFYLGVAILWYEAVPCILSFVCLAYIASNGYNKFVKRFKDLQDDNDEQYIEEDFEIDDED